MLAAFRTGFCTAILGLVACGAAEAPPPRLQGELAGEFALTLLPDPPPLPWKVSLQSLDDGRQRIVLAVESDGTTLQVQVDADLATKSGTWRILEGKLDANRWLGRILTHFGKPGLTAKGTLALTGSGSLKDGVPGGSLRFAWRGGALEDTKAGWALQGIEAAGEFGFDDFRTAVRSLQPATVTVKTITTKRFGARNLAVTARLKDGWTLALDDARVEIAGGYARAAACELPLLSPRVETDVSFERVGLQDIVALVPEVMSEAHGRVDGHVHLTWTPPANFVVGRGELKLSQNEKAEVRLAPTPGLITSNLTPAILQYYPGLDEIELGRVPLIAEAFQVSFTPDGDAEGRTATVHLAGVGKNKKAPVDVTVNVRGPVEPLLRLGMQARGLSFGGNK